MDIRFPAFSLARWIQALSSYTSCTGLIWSRNVSAIKRAGNVCAVVRRNGRQKMFWTGIDRGRNQHGTVVDPRVFNKTTLLFYSGLLDIK